MTLGEEQTCFIGYNENSSTRPSILRRRFEHLLHAPNNSRLWGQSSEQQLGPCPTKLPCSEGQKLGDCSSSVAHAVGKRVEKCPAGVEMREAVAQW